MSNCVDSDETAHYEPSHLELCCLYKSLFASGSERIKPEKVYALHIVDMSYILIIKFSMRYTQNKNQWLLYNIKSIFKYITFFSQRIKPELTRGR